MIITPIIGHELSEKITIDTRIIKIKKFKLRNSLVEDVTSSCSDETDHHEDFSRNAIDIFMALS